MPAMGRQRLVGGAAPVPLRSATIENSRPQDRVRIATMRICLFHTSLPEPGRKPGGVDVLVHRTANALVDAGATVIVASASPRPAGSKYEHRQIMSGRLAHSVLARMFLVPVLLNWLIPRDVDVVHLHGDDWFYVRRHRPTVRTFHGTAWMEARHATRARRRLRMLIVAVLEQISSRLAGSSYRLGTESLGDIGRSGQLPVGVDTTQGYVEKSVYPTILFVGTWSGRKRGWLVHHAFESGVRGFVPQAHLVMVADVAPAEPDVELIRAPDDEYLRRLYAEAWVVCMPSSYEGFGMPYLEALAVGTVPVATPNLGAEFVLDGGRFGSIVRPRDLGLTLRVILSDTTLRERMARAGITRAAEFAWPIVAQKHLVAYRRAARTGRAASSLP